MSLVKTNNLNLPPSGKSYISVLYDYLFSIIAPSIHTGRERIAALASLFRGKMGEGIEFGQHGHFRTEFYKDVKSAVSAYISCRSVPIV